jgi:hypothetical protein
MKLVWLGVICAAAILPCLIGAEIAKMQFDKPSPEAWHDLGFLIPYWTSWVLGIAAALLMLFAIGLWLAAGALFISRRLNSN